MWPVLLGAAAGGLLGAIGGSQKQKSKNFTTSRASIDLGDPSAYESYLQNISQGSFGDISRFINAGPGMGEYQAGFQAQNDLASLLQQLQNSSGLPTADDISSAQNYSRSIFAPRYTNLDQALNEARRNNDIRSTLMGRPVNDPILQAKLAREDVLARERVGAEESAFSSQFAQGLPFQRLGFAQQRADVLGGLANQAIQNRIFLQGLGSNLFNNERQFRFNAADRTQTGNATQTSGGGLAGAINGGLAGFGSFLGAGSSFMQSNALSNYLNSGGPSQSSFGYAPMPSIPSGQLNMGTTPGGFTFSNSNPFNPSSSFTSSYSQPMSGPAFTPFFKPFVTPPQISPYANPAQDIPFGPGGQSAIWDMIYGK